MTDSSLDQLLEQQLMARLRRGDERALEALLASHWDDLVGYASCLLNSSDGGEDVAQDAFVRLWDRRREWRLGSAARPILFRIVRNLVVDQRRSADVRARWVASIPPNNGTSRDAAAAGVEEEELRIAIQRALRALGPREREVLTLIRFHGLARREVAEITGLAPQTVSNLLSAAVVNLGRALESYLDAGQPIPIWRQSLQG